MNLTLTYSCRKVAELLSQRLDEPLGLIDDLRLRLHLSMCRDCSHVASQLEAVHAASAELFESGLGPETGDEPRAPLA